MLKTKIHKNFKRIFFDSDRTTKCVWIFYNEKDIRPWWSYEIKLSTYGNELRNFNRKEYKTYRQAMGTIRQKHPDAYIVVTSKNIKDINIWWRVNREIFNKKLYW